MNKVIGKEGIVRVEIMMDLSQIHMIIYYI